MTVTFYENLEELFLVFQFLTILASSGPEGKRDSPAIVICTLMMLDYDSRIINAIITLVTVTI